MFTTLDGSTVLMRKGNAYTTHYVARRNDAEGALHAVVSCGKYVKLQNGRVSSGKAPVIDALNISAKVFVGKFQHLHTTRVSGAKPAAEVSLTFTLREGA